MRESYYGKILSNWDYLFGAMSKGDRPERYGLTGLEMPVLFLGTFLRPLGNLDEGLHSISRRTESFRRGPFSAASSYP